MPGPSVFPSGEPGVSGDFWVSFSIIPSKEIPGQISFRMDWLDLLAVQGTLKSLLQHHSGKKKPELNDVGSWVGQCLPGSSQFLPDPLPSGTLPALALSGAGTAAHSFPSAGGI